MKKVLAVLAILAAVGGVGTSIYFYSQYSQVSKEKETLVQQNAVLQSSLDAIGPTTTAYTVAATTDMRKPIKSADFVRQTIPQSSVTEDTVLDLSEIEGKLYKVNISPGTTMTKSMVMDVMYEDVMYEQDMYFNYLPLGLKVGDFINVKVTFPHGQTFVALEHLRVEQLVESSDVIKVYLNTVQQEIWRSVLKDYNLYKGIGFSYYLEIKIKFLFN